MNDVTRILSDIEHGDPQAAEQLLPLVYDELRKLAAQKLAQEKPGQTLQATALVHEAYLRLVDVEQAQHWNSRGHFFAAAAEAMRRILVENARRKRRRQARRRPATRSISIDACAMSESPPDDLLALDEALSTLAALDPVGPSWSSCASSAGLTMPEAAADPGHLRGHSRAALELRPGLAVRGTHEGETENLSRGEGFRAVSSHFLSESFSEE